jgi:hypothetical protein
VGIKRELWFSSGVQNCCLGKVGASKFCIKICEAGKSTCGTGRHVSKFLVDSDSAYIRATDMQVFGSPCLSVKDLTDTQRAKLSNMVKMGSEWERLLSDIEQGNFPEWMVDLKDEVKESVSEDDDDNSLELLSPIASATRKGIFDQFPSLSFNSLDSEMEVKEEEDGNAKLELLEKSLRNFKTKLTRPFTDIEASYMVLVSDLNKIRDRVKDVMTILGKDDTQPQLTVWASLKALYAEITISKRECSVWSARVQSISAEQETIDCKMKHMMEEMAELQASLEDTNSWVQNADNLLKVFQRRFQHIRPLIGNMGFLGGTESTTSGNISDLTMLETRIKEVENRLGHTLISSTVDDDSIYRKMIDLEEKIKLLENRVVGAGVQMGNVVFQSFEDLLAWV